MKKKKNRSEDDDFVKDSAWDMFVKVVVAHVDPVLASMLYATEFKEFDQTQKIVRIATLKKFVLFQDLFIEQKKNYQEYLDRIFGYQAVLVVEFTKSSQPIKIVPKMVETKKMELGNQVMHSKNAEPKKIDISDQKKLETYPCLARAFWGNG